MISKNKHIKLLYLKYLHQTTSPEEFDQLFDYLKNPENLEILKQEMDREWRTGSDYERFSPVIWDEIEMEILKRKAEERKDRLERQNNRYRWMAAAASFLLVAGLSLFIYLNLENEEFITYSTGFGEVEKITLDDGSQVTLNANSTLKWKNNWIEAGDRLAILEGEAYFDVETVLDNQNQKTDFDVQTQDLTIEVVGTAFNVKSRTGKTDVFLDEGIVQLDLKGPEKQSQRKKIMSSIVMNPGESVSYSAATKILERAENDQYGNASWMAGTFIYTKEPVGDILKSLEEIYGVNFDVEDKLILDRVLTTALPYSDWPIVESALELLLKARLERKDNKIKIIKKE